MPYFGNNPSPLLLNTVAQNGKEMTLDADADTSITADTDDQIDIKIGGSDIFQLTASKLDINGKELVLDADADTSITADTDDQIDIRIGGADDFQFTANTFTAQSGSTIAAQALTATTITASGIIKTDDATDATTTTDGSLQTDGGLSVVKDAVFGDDVKLLSDSAVLSFGADSEITLTHVHNSGLKLNDDKILYIGDDQDFQFTHLNSSNLQIIDANARLLIRSPRIDFQNGDGSETTGVSIADGVFSLFYDNNEKFTTTTNGISIGGVTPETHHSSMKTVQVGARGFLTPFDSGAVYLNSNLFYNTSSQWEYATAGSGSVLSLNNGSLYYYHAENGSDGTTGATLVERLRLYHNNSNNDNYNYLLANRNSVATYLINEHSSDPYGVYIQFTGASPDNNDEYFLTCHDSTTARLRIYSDGDVVNHDNSYGSSSDERLKQDIVDANSQWDDIKNIKIRNFKKKDDIEKYGDKAWSQIGVIAQELETVSPKLIRETAPSESDVAIDSEFGTVVDDTDKPTYYTEADIIPDGKKVGDVKGYEKKVEAKSNVKAVMYSVLYMKAVKALQEAMTRIETLEAKVKTLEEA